MQLAMSAGVPATLLAGKSKRKKGEEGARSSRHGWQQSIACDKCFRGLQDQNKHVQAQITTTSQSAEVQVAGTKMYNYWRRE